MRYLVVYEIQKEVIDLLQERYLKGKDFKVINVHEKWKFEEEDKLILCGDIVHSGGTVLCKLPSLKFLKSDKKAQTFTHKVLSNIDELLCSSVKKLITVKPVTLKILSSLERLGGEIFFPDLGIGISREGDREHFSFEEIRDLIQLCGVLSSHKVLWKGREILCLKGTEFRHEIIVDVAPQGDSSPHSRGECTEIDSLSKKSSSCGYKDQRGGSQKESGEKQVCILPE